MTSELSTVLKFGGGGDDIDVVIYVIEDEISFKDLNNLVSRLNAIYPDLIFLADHHSDSGYIQCVRTDNGPHSVVLKQRRTKLIEARKKLAQTDYYKFWSNDMIDDVLGDEYKSILDDDNSTQPTL